MNDRLKDFIEVTGKAFKESFAKLDKVYIAFIVILVRAFYQNYRMNGMFSRTMAGGLINYFIDAALLLLCSTSLEKPCCLRQPRQKIYRKLPRQFFSANIKHSLLLLSYKHGIINHPKRHELCRLFDNNGSLRIFYVGNGRRSLY